MTTKAHKDLTGTDIHEPKGIASATSSQVYRADGAGSGSWQTIVIPSGTFTRSIVDFTSTGTWTKPAQLFGIIFHIYGGGGGASAGGTAGAGGSTTLGSWAGVGGAVANNTGATGTAGGSVGTTPSGAKGYAGNTGDAINLFNTWLGTIKDNTPGFIQVSGSTIRGPYTVAPGPHGLKLFGAGAACMSASGTASFSAAGSGAYMNGWIPTATLGATETITIGAGGTAGVGGLAGQAGYCFIEQYITV